MNLVVPFGFYGAGNIGDESMLQGFARLLCRSPNGTRVWVASRNPSHTARIEPGFSYYKSVGCDLRGWWANYRAVARAVVGGTPIMDVLGDWPLSELVPLIQASQVQRKPVVFCGAGTERLLRQQSKRIMSEVLAPAVAHWTVRSERDRERLVEYKVPTERVTVAADLAWMLDTVSPDFGAQCLRQLGIDPQEPLVGVNINNECHMTEREPLFFEKVTAFLDEIIARHNVRLVFLCNEVREAESFDKATSQRLMNSLKHRDRAVLVPNEYRSPQEMLSIVACCRATVSTRYHFCLFSALQGVPFLALQRSDKVADLCWDMSWPYGMSLTDLSSSRLIDLFAEIMDDRRRLVEDLRQQVGRMRERALKNDVALNSVLREVGA
jgi:polysaccharide pyruvyl transferase WcaK-like protein